MSQSSNWAGARTVAQAESPVSGTLSAGDLMFPALLWTGPKPRFVSPDSRSSDQLRHTMSPFPFSVLSAVVLDLARTF